MKDIEDRLQEEYDKVEVPDYMFDTSRVFKRSKKEKNNSKKRVISIVAGIVTLLLVTITVLFAIPKILNDDEAKLEERSIVNDDIKEEIEISNNIITQGAKENSSVISIKMNESIEYIIINNIPYTKIKAQVLNSYLGELSGEIEMYVPGGIFSIKEIKENIKYDQIDDISAFNNEDKVKLTYYNEIYIPVAEEGKTYITTLNEIDGKYFVNMNAKYGFKEYDPETNIVKDDMGDEQLDIDRYLESINI